MGYISVEKNQGLTEKQVEENRIKYGKNQLEEKKGISPLRLFFGQFKDFMTIVLLAATAISAGLGEVVDATVILLIVILNGVLGFVQEFKTEKSLAALRKLSAPMANVIRDGAQKSIPADQLVVGDLILLEAGDRVGADCRLLQGEQLQANESILTGESMPVEKQPYLGGEVKKENLLYMGTNLTTGRGLCQVTAVGMRTEMGKIAGMLGEAQTEETPIKKHLARVGRELVLICLGVCILIILAGMYHGETLYNMFFSGVSLAVAAIPEGLPAIVTVALAIGVQRMLKRNALVRKLPAVETLGSTTVICSDKTGTLTENQMTVTKIYIDGMDIGVENGFYAGGKEIRPGELLQLEQLLKIGGICNNAYYTGDQLCGDPTETAILTATIKGKVPLGEMSRLKELPFQSQRKRMSVVVRDEKGQFYLYVKGAPDKLIGRCSKILTSQGERIMSGQRRQEINSKNETMALQALRVLAFAYKKLDRMPTKLTEQMEEDLVFVGLEGMIDPPRKEAITAIGQCYKAGIRPVMITGDHKVTAVAVARELGIHVEQNGVMIGDEIEQLSDMELQKRVMSVSVFARVTPEHKLRIVRAYKNMGNVVAMTGDGVNDAPALKEADIGIAMGKGGTDVAKEASSMILLDDNFATIVAAVEEGRMIFDNIRKFIRYLLASNLGEILLMGCAAFFGMALPLLPIQILWVNLVTDGLPALALGVDAPDADIMKRKPRRANAGIFSGGLAGIILSSGLIIGASALLSFAATMYLTGGDVPLSRTVCFCTMVMAELLFSFECRSEYKNVFQLGLRGNRYLLLANGLSAALTLMVVYLPVMNAVFKTVPLGINEWLSVALFASLEFIISSVVLGAMKR